VFCAKRGVALRFILAHPSDGRAGQVAVAMRAFQRTDSLDFAASPTDSATLAVTG
jgi:sulfate permease, SulP family